MLRDTTKTHKTALTKAIGRILLDAATRSGQTQEKAAKKTGVTSHRWGSIVSGEHTPTLEVLARCLMAVETDWETFGKALDKKMRED